MNPRLFLMTNKNMEMNINTTGLSIVKSDRPTEHPQSIPQRHPLKPAPLEHVVDPHEVLRYLGAKGRPVSQRTMRKVKTFIERSRKMLNPKVLSEEIEVTSNEGGRIVLSTGEELKSRKLSRALGSCRRVKVFVATVGEQVEDEISDLIASGKTSDAAILDAIASVAVEDAVETYHSGVDRRLQASSRCATLRFSPGYCDWDIKEQHKLFNVIDASRIGVELSDSSLMSPRKSISGIFGIGACTEDSGKPNNPCMMCGKKDCIARRIEN